MARPCSACNHADVEEINIQLMEGVTLKTLSETYNVSVTALHRHKHEHIPMQLTSAQNAQNAAIADSLITRIAELDTKAKDVYAKIVVTL